MTGETHMRSWQFHSVLSNKFVSISWQSSMFVEKTHMKPAHHAQVPSRKDMYVMLVLQLRVCCPVH